MQNPSSDTLEPTNHGIVSISLDLDAWLLSINISLLLLLAVFLILALVVIIGFRVRRYKLVKLNISLGKIGKAEFAPNDKDVQIAHKIWTELVTRKAAIQIDPDHDVIVEVYDSWYSLFTKVRELVSDIPAELLRNEESTQELVRISIATLNDGLRPHLTQWQAKFRNWYVANTDQLKEKSPQELQKEYPEFEELINDMLLLNNQLMQYADELKKIVNGKSN